MSDLTNLKKTGVLFTISISAKLLLDFQVQ